MERHRVKKLLFILIYLSVTIGLSSCEKVINPHLSFTGPRIVIEAEICDEYENHTVRISKTTAFEEPNTFNGVKGAIVEASTPGGQKYRFHETDPGVYSSPKFRGFPGSAYTLKVEAEGETYIASSTMPQSVRPDSLSFKKLSFPGDDHVYPTINFKDNPLLQNQYRFILRINSVNVAYMVTDDKFNNGNNVSELLFYEGEDLKAGDQIEIELQSIDRNVFKYFYALSQIGGNGGPPVAPDNPVSNFDNGALGIFSAHARASLRATIR